MSTQIRNFTYNRQVKKLLTLHEITYKDLCKYWKGGRRNREALRMHLNGRQLNNEEREHVMACIEAVLTDRENARRDL